MSAVSTSVPRPDRRTVPAELEKRLREFLLTNRSSPTGDRLQILDKDFLDRQEKVRQHLENKQRYLFDFQQTHLSAHEELNVRLEEIEQRMNIALQRFDEVTSSPLHLPPSHCVLQGICSSSMFANRVQRSIVVGECSSISSVQC